MGLGDGAQQTLGGEEVFARAAAVQSTLERERRRDVSDEDFETTIVVLQRIITNVGGAAWHW